MTDRYRHSVIVTETRTYKYEVELDGASGWGEADDAETEALRCYYRGDGSASLPSERAEWISCEKVDPVPVPVQGKKESDVTPSD